MSDSLIRELEQLAARWRTEAVQQERFYASGLSDCADELESLLARVREAESALHPDEGYILRADALRCICDAGAWGAEKSALEMVGELPIFLLAPVQADTSDSLETVARDFIHHYSRGNGCSNCGGLPHSSDCFVQRFQDALAPQEKALDAVD